LATVPDGKSVSVDDTEKDIDTAILDSVWEQKNIENDIILSQERLRKIQEKLQLLTKKENWIQKIQTYLRSLFGINALNLPITVNSSKSGISLSVDASKLTSKNSQELLAIYEAISTINTSEDTINSKIKLREAILQVIPEKERRSYQEIFSRATLFDIWDAFKNNLPNKSKELQKYLETYTKQSENTEEITRIQESLPMDRIKIFNSRMEEWKKQGFETLSDPDWFAKTFKIDSAGLMNIINNANKMVDQGVNSVTNGS
jgi:LysM repeat protein